MATFREITYMVLDRGKLMNDDAYVEPEHVMFIISRLRAHLIASKYKQAKAQVAPSNFQSLILTLEPSEQMCGCDNGGMYMAKSVEEIPNLLLINNYEGMATLAPVDAFGCDVKFNIVSTARFSTVGYSKWQRLHSYAAIGPDRHLYLKSPDSGIFDMEAIQITAVFENAEKVAEMQADYQQNDCIDEDTPCDVMDMEFPLEEGLVTLLIDYAAQAVFDMAAKPRDEKNSSDDELGNITNYLNALLKERYKRNNGPEEA